jgi:hypothetical protein
MLPRRRKAEPLPPTVTPDAIMEMLQSQIAEGRASSRPNSRSESRKVIPKKKQTDKPPAQSPRIREKDVADDPCPGPKRPMGSCGCDAPQIPPLTGTGFSYFDKLTERNIFDNPLNDFPALRKLLHQQT